ncbi:hypothetical protein FIBSPDRAFT_182791 [Athelia psychrophila]|uniref:Uncharacterized protein n=1 Tax=Athelia psychrophila TaxID=1759441 RepID=A0A166AH84_9AGAM|nr:hypothetical protein FIBSPDRAFT_182791 [Fibularhizoctonia sp. CBS 109695]
MRQINEDRRRARGSLLKRLEEFAAARRELIRQLEDLYVRETAAQREYNILHNADAPTSDLPDEIIMMIFEEGMRQGHQSHHLGIIASHVSHRLRKVALANPRLWTSIRLTVGGDSYVPDHMRERCATFLSRAMSSHLNIYIRQWPTQNAPHDLESTSKASALLQLIDGHMGHCRHLGIATSHEVGVVRVLECISSQEMPVLTSIELHSGTSAIAFQAPLFASGAQACLRTAQLHGLEPRSMHHCLPAFRSVTSLGLTAIFITSPDLYHALRSAIMALPLLIHCEIGLRYFDPPLPCLPIAMPTLQFLRLDVGRGNQLGLIMRSIQVPSLTTLSLGVRRGQEELGPPNEFLEHFPPVQHLILMNAMPYFSYYEQFACRFPGIERLTHLVTSEYVHHNSDHVLADILRGADGGLRWHNLRTLAVSTTDKDSDASWQGTILKSQHAGHPIRKLMLPQAVIQNAAGALMELRETMDIEAFHVDWPTPFVHMDNRDRLRDI